MPRFFVANEQVKSEKIEILDQDVNHIKNVLRAKIGDELEICNLHTKIAYICKIEEYRKNNIICKIYKQIENKVEPKIKANIYQGLPKNEKMELIIQKSVELGLNSITPVEMKRCIVKLKEKDKIKKIDRWQKQSESAAKQSGRNIIPKVNKVVKIKKICEKIKEYDVFLVAYEKEKNNTLKDEIKKLQKTNKENLEIGILIGPEGGIDKTEIEILSENGAKIITLGDRILRTETVSLNVLSIIMYELEK